MGVNALHATTTQEKVKTGGLCHIAIDVSDLKRSEKFYTDMFDMEATGRSDHYVRLQTPGGHDSFFLFKADGPVRPRECGLTHMHFGFRIDEGNFEKAMGYIKRNNIKVHHNPARGTGHFIYIEDPDGYVIQLEPGDCE
jgi:catechol 2,3-dioxygenase-like lactoylglutathione lyase family enzyme